ncbi:hypothetical protein ACFPN7_09985 [Amycolatopsis halotolerans]|uniref:hypothetical protein n=1 Tax=Amycolatopsis halotolerans TaxID=330083 RepID=UPI00360E3123
MIRISAGGTIPPLFAPARQCGPTTPFDLVAQRRTRRCRRAGTAIAKARPGTFTTLFPHDLPREERTRHACFPVQRRKSPPVPFRALDGPSREPED